MTLRLCWGFLTLRGRHSLGAGGGRALATLLIIKEMRRAWHEG